MIVRDGWWRTWDVNKRLQPCDDDDDDDDDDDGGDDDDDDDEKHPPKKRPAIWWTNWWIPRHGDNSDFARHRSGSREFGLGLTVLFQYHRGQTFNSAISVVSNSIWRPKILVLVSVCKIQSHLTSVWWRRAATHRICCFMFVLHLLSMLWYGPLGGAGQW